MIILRKQGVKRGCEEQGDPDLHPDPHTYIGVNPLYFDVAFRLDIGGELFHQDHEDILDTLTSILPPRSPDSVPVEERGCGCESPGPGGGMLLST